MPANKNLKPPKEHYVGFSTPLPMQQKNSIDMNKSPLAEKIIELWHISRTALAVSESGRHARMTYVKNELLNKHADLVRNLSPKALWFEIDEHTSSTN